MKAKHPRSRKSAVIPNGRWAAYATAGAATALTAVNTVEADIHYSGPINQSFNASPGEATSVYFQLDQPGNSIIPFHRRFSPPDSNSGLALFFMYGLAAGSVAGFSASAGLGSFKYASKLAFGQNISTRPFVSVSGYLASASFPGNSQWQDAGLGFVGFRFDGGSGLQYGWARLNMDGAPGNSFTWWTLPGQIWVIASPQVRSPNPVRSLFSLWAVLAWWLGVGNARKRLG